MESPFDRNDSLSCVVLYRAIPAVHYIMPSQLSMRLLLAIAPGCTLTLLCDPRHVLRRHNWPANLVCG